MIKNCPKGYPHINCWDCREFYDNRCYWDIPSKPIDQILTLEERLEMLSEYEKYHELSPILQRAQGWEDKIDTSLQSRLTIVEQKLDSLSKPHQGVGIET